MAVRFKHSANHNIELIFSGLVTVPQLHRVYTQIKSSYALRSIIADYTEMMLTDDALLFGGESGRQLFNIIACDDFKHFIAVIPTRHPLKREHQRWFGAAHLDHKLVLTKTIWSARAIAENPTGANHVSA